jgi:antitoxin VapB
VAFHVRDPKTDALVRELARKRGIGITEAIREAVEQVLAEDTAANGRTAEGSLLERLQPLFDRVDRMPRSGLVADKKFFDEMWGQEGDD